MSTPDTTEAVSRALIAADKLAYGNTRPLTQDDIDEAGPWFTQTARQSIEADRKALAEQGYVIVKKETE